MSDQVTIPSIEALLEAGAHYGHTTQRWHPKAKPFLFGKRGEIHVIDVAKTRDALTRIATFVSKIAAEGKPILFVGVKPLARKIVVAAAERAQSPYVVNRWIGGMLTNWAAISNMQKRMKKFEDDTASRRLAKYTKREQLEFTEEYDKLNKDIGGIRSLTSGTPGAVFIVDSKYDKTALAEARKLKVPVIALADSNVDPSKITYPIPANDDSLKSVELITNVIADAVLAGKGKTKSE
ncbi:30S ribosomal protein S2 [bacterium CG10_46_32]|nr:MAG: 30S ribosomal protein S2 [bacterium CG10_46_32]PIR55731.1 MAG: 30S ribosomal protein S2 [Parcubacteria group bacterium CG10_big_fil_rev_8_21_14_0_10_46_32]